MGYFRSSTAGCAVTAFRPDLILKGNMSKHDIFKFYFAWTRSGIHMLLLPDITPLSHLILNRMPQLFLSSSENVILLLL